MMPWWQTPEYARDVEGVLSHLNEAQDRMNSVPATRLCELYFHAFNKLWNSFARHNQQPSRADTPAFIALLHSIPREFRDDLLRNASVSALIDLTPEILDHSILKSRPYHHGLTISNADRSAATEKHRKLRDAYSQWVGEGCETDGLLKKFAELLYVIRSNIAHGEKTPYGPDLDKAKRDEEVSAVTLPVQERIVYLLLDRPDRKLVAYGTLAPGGANEQVLAAVHGEWKSCLVRGRVREERGLRFFRWDPRAGPVETTMLTAPELAECWERLDRFEGGRYQRHLVLVEVGDTLEVATIYEERP